MAHVAAAIAAAGTTVMSEQSGRRKEKLGEGVQKTRNNNIYYTMRGNLLYTLLYRAIFPFAGEYHAQIILFMYLVWMII